MPLCDNDPTLEAAANCRELDFTVAFEQCILSILPDAIFILTALGRFMYLRGSATKLERLGWLAAVKSFVLLLITSSAIAVVVLLATRHDDLGTVYDVPAAAIELVASIPLAALVLYEHNKTFVPSTMAICYAVVKVIFNAAILRTYHDIGVLFTSQPLFIAFAINSGAYLCLICAELVEKRGLFLQEYANLPKESSSSFISRSFYFWLLPLMWRGRSTQLTIGDLREFPAELNALESRQPLEDAIHSSNPRSSFFLLIATAKAFGLAFSAPIPSRLILLATTFLQPILVNEMLSYVSDAASTDAKGWAILGGFTCVYVIMTLTTALYWEAVYNLIVQFRGALVGCIYAKTLRLASHSSRPLGAGLGSTYMSVDVERICTGMEYLHEFWAAILSIPVAVVLLYFQAGWAAFTPLPVVAVFMTITSLFGKHLRKRQSNWSALTDKRIKLLSSVIGQLLPIKMSAYEPLLEEQISARRRDEMGGARAFYNTVTITAGLSNGVAGLCVLVTLATYAAVLLQEGKTLSVTSVFTIFITVNLLNGPLNVIGQTLPSILAAYASLIRIQGFLLLDEQDMSFRSEEADEKQEVKVDGSFTLAKDMHPILKDIHLTISPGRLHMCVGPVASGKTTLLSTLLGETCLLSGTWSIPNVAIAYASQDAFIMPGTVKENILFGSVFVQERYDRVVRACSLGPDFERLPYGDETRLGDKGSSVSGGQRQRIGLARAVYKDANITLLDDPLSALDGETEAHVFLSLFGVDGLLAGKTVVLVTHNIQHLNHADHVIVLEQGTVSMQGTFAEISSNGYDLAHLVSLKKGKAAETHTEAGTSKTQTDDKPTKKVNDTEEDEMTRQYTDGGFAPYAFYAISAGLGRTIIAMSLLLVTNITRLAVQGFLKNWSESRSTDIVGWIGGYAGFAVGQIILGMVGFYYFDNVFMLHAVTAIHNMEVKALIRAPFSWFSRMSSGRLTNRFSQDVFSIDFTFPIAVLNSVSSTYMLLGSLILIFIPAPWLTLSLPVLVLINWFLVKFYLATSKQIQQLEAASKSPLYTTFGTTLAGLESIRAFKSASYFQAQNDKSLDDSQGPFHFRFAGIRFLKTSLTAVTLILVVTLAALAVGLRKSTNPAFLGIALSSLTDFSTVLARLLMNWSTVENGSVSVERIREVCLVEPEEDPGSTGISKTAKHEVWPSKGSLVFQDFSLKYRAELEPALHNLSFRIKPGQKVGICGRTGSGKSSTVQALFRTIHHSLVSGEIYIDGVNIGTLPLAMVRKALSLVTQDPFLWHGTLRDNLDLEHVRSDEEIWDALEKVGMKDAIKQLEMKDENTASSDSEKPNKLTFVLEDSGSFSRGQRQLLCMARVLLRKRRIVILDEASSSMDLRTDEKIREVVRTELKDQTVISVAHRIATIINFDLILVLDKGEIIESGSPEELMANPDSQFRRLAQSQGLVQADDSDGSSLEIREEKAA